MAKVTQLVGWMIAVTDTEIPDVDDDGQVRFDMVGQPKMKAAKALVLHDPATAEQLHLSLAEETRLTVVAELTGGVVVATNLDRVIH